LVKGGRKGPLAKNNEKIPARGGGHIWGRMYQGGSNKPSSLET